MTDMIDNGIDGDEEPTAVDEFARLVAMAVAENAFLLAGGLLTGTVCALVAITPALIDRGGRLPGELLILLLAGVFVLGLITSVVATTLALRTPLLTALRSE